jgi:NAD(P)-dependent dehydrogenase (short-subunit alcohol dehydrogenase family)
VGGDPVTSEITNYRDAFSLDGKVALVTGAAGTLGAEICRGLTSVGASVLITDIVEDRGIALRDELRNRGANAEFFKHNVTDESDWEAAMKMAVDSFGGLDTVVNAAAIVPMRLLADLDVEEFKKVQDVNVAGTLLGCKHASMTMRPGGISGRGGSIINLSSVMGLSGSIALASYNSSKGAVRLLTKSVAAECAMLNTGVRCNSIHPGIIDSDMGTLFLKQLVDLGVVPDMETAEAGFLAGVPMGESGKPQDIAAGIIYLASDASRYMTGAELVIDGGFYAT